MICEICKENFPSLDKHHIHSQCFGGKNVSANRCSICPNCHRSCHLGHTVIEGWFDSTGGRVLIWREKGKVSITGTKDPEVYVYERQK